MNFIIIKGRHKTSMVMFLGGLFFTPCTAVLSALTNGFLSKALFYLIFPCLTVAIVGLVSLLSRRKDDDV